MPTNKEIAQKIVDVAKELGWNVQVRGDILTITKNIRRNDNDDFVRADMEYYSIIGLLPRTQPGSDWGTTGDGCGALSALANGKFVVNRSGGSKRVLKWVSTLV